MKKILLLTLSSMLIVNANAESINEARDKVRSSIQIVEPKSSEFEKYSRKKTYQTKIIEFNKFEEKAIIESELNRLGNEGWRTIDIETMPYNGAVILIRFYLEREL